MGQQIIKQPNGKYAVFSSVVDAFVVFDCTRGEVVEHFARHAADDAKRTLLELDAGGKPYHQFTMTWQEAVARHIKNFPGDEMNFDLLEI